MTFTKLLLRNLWFHRRSNLAILLGVLVGTAVLTGSLLVGDSLRGSLRELTLERLGWVDQTLVATHFFREEVADELKKGNVADHIAPVIMLQASVKSKNGTARKVTLLGVDDRYWKGKPPPVHKSVDQSAPIVHLSRPLAQALKAGVGEEIVIHIRKRSEVPEESLLGRKKTGDLLSELEVTVGGILDRDRSMASFKMSSDPQPARNAFVSLSWLQQKLDEEKKQVNALLIQNGKPDLQTRLRETLTLEDWGLILRSPKSRAQRLMQVDRRIKRQGGLRSRDWKGRVAASTIPEIDVNKDRLLTEKEIEEFYAKKRGYLSLESRRLMLRPPMVDAVMRAAKSSRLHIAQTFVHLANSIHKKGEPQNEIPYSVVAAVDPSKSAPLGPFLPKGVTMLKDDEIVLVQWDDSPLKAQVGDSINVTYFEPEHHGKPKEETTTFQLKGFVPLEGVTGDDGLTPEFPGITDKLTLATWNPPFPYDNKRVKPRDDEYWQNHRTAPKAFITLTQGKKLWRSRFGEVTSIRLAPRSGQSLEEAETIFRRDLLKTLKPEQGGFVFVSLKEGNLKASQGGGFDFGMLFVGFSFFLILAALLLVGLLFRLSIDRRASEIGLLFAVGFTRKRARNLLLVEGCLLSLIGGLLGTGVAIVYSGFLLDFLKGQWAGAGDLFFLERHVEVKSLAVGCVSTVAMSLLTIYWSLRALRKVAPRGLLHGETTQVTLVRQGPPRKRIWTIIVCLILSVILLIAGNFVQQHEARAGTFFGSGSLLLIAGLCALSAWLSRGGRSNVTAGGSWALAQLGARNAGRHSTRSMLTAGLLASAAFLLVAVECFRRQPGENFLEKDSGSGGYALLAESDLPIVTDFSTEAGREELIVRLEAIYQDEPDARKPDPDNPKQTILESKLSTARELLKKTGLQSFRVRAGDDASCLNLYQPRKPNVMGVPDSLITRGGFAFSAKVEDTEKPWGILKKNDSVVPVFGEQNTVIWMLKAGVGDVLEIEDEQGEKKKVRISGLLHDSVFQSSLLMSEEHFKELYPQEVGYRFFLIQPPKGEEEAVTKLLKDALAEQGLEVVRTKDRLQQYLAVENMYLSTFQALGGMGLLLGSLGLAIVLLRSVWERRAELALLRALGYRRRAIGWLVLTENGFLLLLGLILGTLAALISVAPHVLGSGGSVDWLGLSRTLALVLALGVVVIVIAVAVTVRASLIPALRKE